MATPTRDSSVRLLKSAGCCSRCILVYHSVRDYSVYQTDASVSQALFNVIHNPAALQFALNPHNLNKEEVYDNNGCMLHDGESCKNSTLCPTPTEEDLASLKDCTELCVSCLGFLQNQSFSTQSIQNLCAPAIAARYDATNFLLSVFLPGCIISRAAVIAGHCKQNGLATLACDRIVVLMKDVWKSLAGPIMGKHMGKKFCISTAPLTVPVNVSYTEDGQECQNFMSHTGYMGPKKKRQRDKKRRFKDPMLPSNDDSVAVNNGNGCGDVDNSEFSLTALVATANTALASGVLHQLPLPSPPLQAVKIEALTPSHVPVFVAGRYCKYSRELSQTPWIIDGQLKSVTSVEQLISNDILIKLGAQEQKFLSSGREDVDVRCLGRGRPFALEVRDPHVTAVTVLEMKALQEKINSSTTEVKVSHLQLMTNKESTSALRFNTDEKVKSYCALCVVKGTTVSEELLEKLKDVTPLVLQQQTPIRVLHRRPLLTRPRTVHTLITSQVSQQFFKLHLRTEAGTYIKEFVHGDFGRTQPNVSSLLGVAVDIVALDVEDVEVDWPPEVE